MRKDYRISVTLTLVAPIITQGLEGKLLGIDTAAWQVEQDGQSYPALPASLIRGNLRHAWKRLIELAGDNFMSPTAITDWLGDESRENTFNMPVRARLRSSDHWLANLATTPNMRYRIAIDPETGAVKRGAVQVIESPYPAGLRVNYTGWFEVSTDAAEAAEIRQKIMQGLQFVPALGAFKNVGFGQIETMVVSEPQACEPQKLNLPDSDSFGVVLQLDRPICFAKTHAGDNRFESESHIPGAALKGALLNRITQLAGDEPRWQMLRKWIDDVRFTHAFSALPDAQQRGIPVPFSLYSDGKAIQDAALNPEQAISGSKAPVFQPDWKAEWGAVSPVFSGLPADKEPQRELRVRTAIEAGSQAAEDEKLFALDVLASNKHVWLSNISLHQVDATERPTVQKELLDLLGYGLNGLGKTRAITSSIAVRKTIPATQEIPKIDVLQTGQHLRLLLVTPARLLPDQLHLPATNGGKQLHAHYAASWEALSGGSLQLLRFFARQDLYGGNHYQQRFRLVEDDSVYNPLLLTNAGSVFVLAVVDAVKARECLQQWQQNGLPQLSGIAGGNHWKTNPLLAANGYGEILVDPSIPTIELPIKEEKAHV
jgi:hypothetical protein